MDIIGGIGAATEGLKMLNELRKIDKELDKAELKLRLVEVADKLLDSKQALQDAQERELVLKRKISALEAAFAEKGKLADADGLLFRLGHDGQTNGDPYCNQCYVKEARLFRLVFGPFSNQTTHRCSNCSGYFGKVSKQYEGSGLSTSYDVLNPYSDD